jgi:hypothetical protein
MNSANWEQFGFRFDLDGTSQSEGYYQVRNANPDTTQQWVTTIHAVFTGVSAAAHTVKAQWRSPSNLDCTIKTRRLTVMVCQ